MLHYIIDVPFRPRTIVVQRYSSGNHGPPKPVVLGMQKKLRFEAASELSEIWHRISLIETLVEVERRFGDGYVDGKA